MDRSEVVPKLREHRLRDVGFAWRLGVLEAKPLGPTGFADAVVFETPGVGLREASGFGGNRDCRSPEVLLAVVITDALEAVFGLADVGGWLGGVISLVAE